MNTVNYEMEVNHLFLKHLLTVRVPIFHSNTKNVAILICNLQAAEDIANQHCSLIPQIVAEIQWVTKTTDIMSLESIMADIVVLS